MNQTTVPASRARPKVHPGGEVLGLAAVITIVCFAAYLAVVWASGNIGDPIGGDDGYLRFVGFFGLILVWLASLVAITLRARVSALWAIGGVVLGICWTPIVYFTFVALNGGFNGD